MAHTFKYTVLTAIPDRRRGERVNIGIVVFREHDLDVRFRLAAHKLKALTGDVWDSRIEAIQSRISKSFNGDAPAEDMLRQIQNVDPIISPVGMGVMTSAGPVEYEKRIEEILSSLVLLPKRKREAADIQTRINTEITKIFKRDGVLAAPQESISKKRIVRSLPVALNEGLIADFALQNGRLHVASTLDLRKANAPLGEAALKSIVLDKSHKVFKKQKVRTIGIYAVDRDLRSNFKKHIELLDDYADELFNWTDAKQQKRFIRTMYDAMPAPFFNHK